MLRVPVAAIVDHMVMNHQLADHSINDYDTEPLKNNLFKLI